MDFTFKNKLLYIISLTLRATAMLCATGPLMQTFIEVLGIDSSFNYFHTSVIQIVNILVILICSRFADTDSILKRSAIVNIPTGILFLLYIPLCFSNGHNASDILILLSAGILQSVFCALYTVCDYKLPYHIFMPDDYGIIISAGGIISSVVSLAFCTAISYFSAIYDYKIIMIFSFVISAIFMIISSVLFFFLKSLICKPTVERSDKSQKISLGKIFMHPVFYKLLIPNFLRGFAFGTTTVFTIIAFTLGYDEKTATLMVTIQSATFFVGYFIFGFLSKHMKYKNIILFSGLTFLLLPLMLIPNSLLFLSVFAIILCARTMVDCAVPAILLKAVPIEIAGPYNAWRMVIHTAGILAATSLAAILSPQLLILITTICHLIFSFSYIVTKEIKK